MHFPASRIAGSGGLREIPLDAIAGTLEPSRAAQFDGAFRPVSKAARRRWERIWLAEDRGTILPPIAVVPVGDGSTRCSTAITASRSPTPAARSRSTPPSPHAERPGLPAGA